MHLVLNVAIDFHPGVGLVVVVGVVLRSHQRVLGLGHQGKSCKDSDSNETLVSYLSCLSTNQWNYTLNVLTVCVTGADMIILSTAHDLF